MSVPRAKIEESYPDVSEHPKGIRFADYEYLAEFNPCVVNRESFLADTNEWLNRKATEGWALVSVSEGVYYFRREGRCLYELTQEDRLERRRFGNNS